MKTVTDRNTQYRNILAIRSSPVNGMLADDFAAAKPRSMSEFWWNVRSFFEKSFGILKVVLQPLVSLFFFQLVVGGASILPTWRILVVVIFGTIFYYLEQLIVISFADERIRRFPRWFAYLANVAAILWPFVMINSVLLRRKLAANMENPVLHYLAYAIFGVNLALFRASYFFPEAMSRSTTYLASWFMLAGIYFPAYLFRHRFLKPKVRSSARSECEGRQYDVQKEQSWCRDRFTGDFSLLIPCWFVSTQVAPLLLALGLRFIMQIKNGFLAAVAWYIGVACMKSWCGVLAKTMCRSPASAAAILIPYQCCEDIVGNILLVTGVEPFSVEWFLTLVFVISYELYRDTFFKTHQRRAKSWIRSRCALLFSHLRGALGGGSHPHVGDVVSAEDADNISDLEKAFDLFVNTQNIFVEIVAGGTGITLFALFF